MTIDLVELVQASGGEIVGKVRFQKIVYLLDRLGVDSGFNFEYRHYGPYSEAMADQLEEEQVFGRLTVERRRRQTDGVPFTVYVAPGKDRLRLADRQRVALEAMEEYSSTVLELAATIDWLYDVESVEDWHAELARRKGAKVEGGREAKAVDLLDKLGLRPQ